MNEGELSMTTPLSSEPDVDIIISTYARGDKIVLAIESILSNTYPHFTLWVIDESEDDQTERCVTEYVRRDSRVRYSRSKLHGSAAKRNAAVSFGSAPYLLFTNDDCRVAPNWVELMRAELMKPDTWAAFGRVLPGTQDPAGAPWFDPGSERQIVIALKETPHAETFRKNRFNLGFGQGHCMGFRRVRYEEIGGMDELLGTGTGLGAWDDRDLGYRVLIRGGTIRYTPDAVLYHHHWLSWNDVVRQSRHYATGTGSSAAKYIRCGDSVGWYLLGEWVVDQGLRQVLSGVFKRHSKGKIKVGLAQMYYPFVGFLRGLQQPIDRETLTFRHS
jgi:GT2 family glycosyltransferase